MSLTACSQPAAQWVEGSSPGPSIAPTPSASPCTGYPPNNVWRVDVSKLPVLKTSATIVNSIGANVAVHPDFGAGIGIPVTQVKPDQPKVPVTFEYKTESDQGPYPVPANALVESGSDRHVILNDATNCKVYELFAAYPASGGAWRAGSGAIFDLKSDKLRPAGWTSADAAGLPIFAGLAQFDDLKHALRITVPKTRNSYVWPARHFASTSADAALPPMGLRLRLKANTDLSKLSEQARQVAMAMQKYGVIIADNGSPWYISGAPDDRWSNDALHTLNQLHGKDFEAVDVSGLMINPDSASCKG